MPSTHSTPISTSGKTSQNESSTTNLLPMSLQSPGRNAGAAFFSLTHIYTILWNILRNNSACTQFFQIFCV